METLSSHVVVWALSGYQLNSIRLQAGLLADALQKQKGVTAEVLDSEIVDYKQRILTALKNHTPLVWQFGGFDRNLSYMVARCKNVLFVYHNITPAWYFARSEPKVALGSLLGQLQLRLLPKCVRWVTCSSFNANQLRNAGFRNVTICPNIVPVPLRLRKSRRQPLTLIFVGRICPNKGCIQLLEQTRLSAIALQEQVTLTIIGRIKIGCPYGKRFQNMVRSINGDMFLTIEWIQTEVSDVELSNRYANASLYVSAARHEGFGLPVCEAIAAGTPAIYLECGGTESILQRHGLVPDCEADLMWRYIASILNEPQQYAELIEAQQQLVRQYTYPAVNINVERVYGSWLKEFRGK